MKSSERLQSDETGAEITAADLLMEIKQRLRTGFIEQGSKFKKAGEFSPEDSIFKAYEELEILVQDVADSFEADSQVKSLKIKKEQKDTLVNLFFLYANQIKILSENPAMLEAYKHTLKQSIKDFLIRIAEQKQ